MAKTGRKPKPDAIRLVDGTHRRDRHGDPGAAVQPGAADLTPPTILKRHGLAVWRSLAPRLSELGVFTALDRLALETYCRAHDEIARLDAVLKRKGEYFTADSGYVGQHPAVNQRFKWLDVKRRYEVEFGLTPSSRNGVQAQKKPSGVPSRQRA